MYVEIYHNVSRDAGFGLNACSDGHGSAFPARDSDEQHPLVKVFEFKLDDHILTRGGQVHALLALVYRWFHSPPPPPEPHVRDLSEEYFSRRLRSLGRGDVVLVDNRPFSVWSAVEFTEADHDSLKVVWDGFHWVRGEERRWLPYGGDAVTVPYDGQERFKGGVIR